MISSNISKNIISKAKGTIASYLPTDSLPIVKTPHIPSNAHGHFQENIQKKPIKLLGIKLKKSSMSPKISTR